MVVTPHPEHRAASEEMVAATRLVLGLSAAVGAVAGTIGLVTVQPLALLAIPSAILLVGLVLGALPVAAWAAAAMWAGILPNAHAEAMFGPLLMILACVAIAVGPDRFIALAWRDFGGRPGDRQDASGIEEV
jgi:hypothetical protein